MRPQSVAEVAGLRAGQISSEVGGNHVQLGGDFILMVNGVPASDTAGVAKALRALKVGELIKYDVIRGGKPAHVEVPVPAGLSVPVLMRPRK